MEQDSLLALFDFYLEERDRVIAKRERKSSKEGARFVVGVVRF